ncbi:MAG: hypothetical protein WCJ30_25845, partial [Deltaproteobacteria bacterium]
MKSLAFAGVVALSLVGCGPAGGGGGGPMTVGTPVTGTIGFLSGESTIPGRAGTTTYRRDIWTVPLTTGSPVTVLLCRTGTVSFDPYLAVHGPGGPTDDLHNDDDSAGSLNSRLVLTPTATGSYTIYASTFSSFSSSSTAGNYTLSVTAGENPTASALV